MPTGSNLGASINFALENSEYLLYFASKEAAQSEWVQKELRKWCGELKRADKLIIILIADEIKTDFQKIIWAESDALPAFLEEYIADIPIYEDLRWSKQDELLTLENIRFRESINSITAQLRGKTPAEINDENVRIDKRNRRIIRASIGILAVLFISAIIFAWIAVVQKNRADEQKSIAGNNAQKARAQEAIAKVEKKRADQQTQIANDKTKDAIKQREIAIKNEQKALEEKKRADKQYKIAVCNRLASEVELILPNDRYKAIRMAEAAYKISLPAPPASVLRFLCTAAITTLKNPFYSRSFNHAGDVNSAVFSPDGQRVLTASWDNTAKLWDTQGKLVAEFKGHTGRVFSAMFSPDGKHIISTSEDGTSLTWPTPETIVEYLKTAGFPKLTAEEKKELGIDGFNLD